MTNALNAQISTSAYTPPALSKPEAYVIGSSSGGTFCPIDHKNKQLNEAVAKIATLAHEILTKNQTFLASDPNITIGLHPFLYVTYVGVDGKVQTLDRTSNKALDEALTKAQGLVGKLLQLSTSPDVEIVGAAKEGRQPLTPWISPTNTWMKQRLPHFSAYFTMQIEGSTLYDRLMKTLGPDVEKQKKGSQAVRSAREFHSSLQEELEKAGQTLQLRTAQTPTLKPQLDQLQTFTQQLDSLEFDAIGWAVGTLAQRELPNTQALHDCANEIKKSVQQDLSSRIKIEPEPTTSQIWRTLRGIDSNEKQIKQELNRHIDDYALDTASLLVTTQNDLITWQSNQNLGSTAPSLERFIVDNTIHAKTATEDDARRSLKAIGLQFDKEVEEIVVKAIVAARTKASIDDTKFPCTGNTPADWN